MSALPEFTNVVQANNILDGEWADLNQGDTPFAPLEQDILWAPRNDGFRGYQNRRLWPEFASPADSITSGKPTITSPALGTASEDLVACLDITGEMRPSFPSIGAWERPDQNI